jgi:hypothetical protein
MFTCKARQRQSFLMFNMSLFRKMNSKIQSDDKGQND